MSSVGPWSVKGIDSRAREIAKDQARRSGQTLGEWLNTRIIDPEGEPAPEPPPGRWDEPDPRPSNPIYRAEPPRAPPPREPARSWSERRGPEDAKVEDMRRVADALGELSARIDDAERRSTGAIGDVDKQVSGALSRLDAVDNAHAEAVARVEGQVAELRGAQAKLGDRLHTMQEQDGPRLEAMKALESALGKLATQMLDAEARHRTARGDAAATTAEIGRRVDALDQRSENTADAELVENRLAELATRLDQAEARTRLAVRALETSFAGLDRRMAELRTAPETARAALEARFDALDADLSRRAEASRTGVAADVQAHAAGRLDALEDRLSEVDGAAAAADKRSATAIDAVGHEVVRIAQGLGARMAASEARQAQSEARIGAELGRIGGAVEARLQHNDTAQAEALERLGEEIARIAEKLADRIAAAEHRTAQASADLGDQLGRVSATLAARQEATVSDATRRLEASAATGASLTSPAPAPPPPAPADRIASPVELALEGPEPQNLWRSIAFDETPPPDAVASAEDNGLQPHTRPETARANPAAGPPRTFEPETSALSDFDADSFEAEPFKSGPFDAEVAARGLRFDAELDREPAKVEVAPDAPLQLGSAFAPRAPAETAPVKAISTRELIEAARAAARAAAEARGRRSPAEPTASLVAPPPAPSAFEAVPDAPPPVGGFAMPTWRRKRPSGPSLRTFVLSSAVASSIAATGAGALLLATGHERGGAPAPTAAHDPRPSADTLALALSPPAVVETAAPSDPTPRAHAGQAAPATSAAVEPDPAHSAQEIFAEASAALAHDAPDGVVGVRRAANLGYAPAQFYLGRLYEEGRAGVPRDLAEARRWTERAAMQGDVHAMFNLGLFFANGDGGARSPAAAVVWFQRAAAAGVRDAQYNLAVMYQNGDGVARSPEEAFKWYLIAATRGDAGAKTAAEQLGPLLTAARRAAAEHDAASFDSRLAGAPTLTTAD